MGEERFLKIEQESERNKEKILQMKTEIKRNGERREEKEWKSQRKKNKYRGQKGIKKDNNK